MNTGETAPLAAALTDRYLIERELGAGGMATVYRTAGQAAPPHSRRLLGKGDG